MKLPEHTQLENFFVAGINYRKCDLPLRGLFAVNDTQYEKILRHALCTDMGPVFVLSTCNRTEIYGFAKNAAELGALLCTFTNGTFEEFASVAYQKCGLEAISHLYRVAAGLDSQILGDHEIVAQLKRAVKFAQDRGCGNAFTDRLVGSVLQASKAIRSQTDLGSGPVSAAHAAVRYIVDNVENFDEKSILLIGTEKIGRKTCKSLALKFPPRQVTLMNRTYETALALAQEMGFNCVGMDALYEELEKANIIITAAAASISIIRREHLACAGKKLLIDLAVPANVDGDVFGLPSVTLVTIDLLSKQKDAALAKRLASVPFAEAIIDQHLTQFRDWLLRYQHAPLLRSVKKILLKLAASRQAELDNPDTRCPYLAAEQRVQSVLNDIASGLKSGRLPACSGLVAVNEYLNRFSVVS